MAGPAEIYLAYLTLTIALGQKDIQTKTGQTAATGVLATATAALNAVMALNPFILIAMAIIVLIGALIILEKKFGFVTKSVDMLNAALDRMDELVTGLINGVKGLASVLIN